MTLLDTSILIIAGLSIIFGLVCGSFYKNKIKSTNTSFADRLRLGKRNKRDPEQLKDSESSLFRKQGDLLADEIKVYQFEKNLVARAIENILSASKKGSIDSYERDRLLMKYRDELKILNDKMEKIQSNIDITNLVYLRQDLAELIENKISAIDDKMKDINNKIQTNYKIIDTRKSNSKNDTETKTYNVNTIEENVEDLVDREIKQSREFTNNLDSSKINSNVDLMNTNPKQEMKIKEIQERVTMALNRLDTIKELDENNFNNNVSGQDADKNISPLSHLKYQINNKDHKIQDNM